MHDAYALQFIASSSCLVVFRWILSGRSRTCCCRLSDCLSILLVFVDGPVKHVVILKAFTNEQIPEDFPQVAVVGLVVEPKRPGVVEVDGELVGEAAAKDFSRRRHLLLHDAVIFLFLGGSLQALPGQRATDKVQHDVAQRFHIIAPGLFHAQMRVDGGVACRAGQVLVLAVRNVEVGFWVAVFLGQAKVDAVDLIAAFSNPHQEVVRLDVAMDEGLGVDILDARNELIHEQKNRLERKFAVAEVEQVFQAGPQQIVDHGIVVAFGAEPANEWDANTASERFVDASFVLELRVLGLDALQLDGDFFARDDVGSQVHVAEGSGADLAANPVFVTDSEVLQGGLGAK